ncbi:GerW family sporulation protein [Paenibacillus flagellatus]|uniref:Sporulation protein YtfJ n=1 Tax=Paenibacillus flagellatus TaxID=2211139 RepID=A0A2V5K832_9BACL|nr:GerW family sporulation protein [Paenibacillus flagellatus]PYI54992.1 sporulation protein YtfJ [Paenibacillus flagellatus]
MAEHPIQGLMKTAMENIKEMVDVNTIVGDPVETPDGSVIMPISKVGFGFAAGGSEFAVEAEEERNNAGRTDAHNAHVSLPFGGGSGGGVSITPIAFLVVGKHGVKVVPLDNQTHLYERLIDSAPQVVDKIQSMLKTNKNASGTQSGMGGAGGMSGSNGTTIITDETNVIV